MVLSQVYLRWLTMKTQLMGELAALGEKNSRSVRRKHLERDGRRGHWLPYLSGNALETEPNGEVF